MLSNKTDHISIVFTGSGLHCIASKQAEEIFEIVTLASQGKTASCRKANKRSKYLTESASHILCSYHNFIKILTYILHSTKKQKKLPPSSNKRNTQMI